jgi:uncharacterized membrane protein YhaH (DUF805 family)
MDAAKLWQNFMDQVTNHYMDFNGRMGRAQFWYFILICAGVYVVAAILGVFLGIIPGIVGLGLLLPQGGMAARRMQDTGRSGQLVWIWVIIAAIYQVFGLLIWMGGAGALLFLAFLFSIGWLIGLVYIVATIAIIYFCVQPGTPGDNAFGPPPPAWTPNAGTP